VTILLISNVCVLNAMSNSLRGLLEPLGIAGVRP